MKPRKVTIDRGTYGPLGYTGSGYRSVTTATTEGRTSLPGAGSYHYQYHRAALADQARDFLRNNLLFRGMINRAVDYIVAGGFGFQSRSKSQAWNRKREALWAEFWKRPDARGILSGPRLERMVARECLSIGDCGVVLTNKGKIQPIEAEQIVSSKYSDGCQVDKDGAPLTWFVAQYDARGQANKSKAVPYKPGSQFLFIADPDRPSSLRATPPLQSAFPMLHRINDVCDSEAAAWQILSRFAVALTRENAAGAAVGESRDAEKASPEGDLAPRITELDYALIFHANPGESLTGIERNIPGMNFTQSLLTFMRLLGLPLGMPLELILLDWSHLNFSQSRAVLQQAFKTFSGWQYILRDDWIDPVVNWKTDEWIEDGILEDRPDKRAQDWILPPFPWLDEMAEASAAGEKIDRGFATHATVLKGLNLDRDDVVADIDLIIRDAIKRAKAISEETGYPVPWQVFAGMKAPGQASGNAATASVGGGKPAEKQEKPEEPEEPEEPEKEEDGDDAEEVDE